MKATEGYLGMPRNEFAMSLDEIAEAEGITRERVRQILAVALSKLKHGQRRRLREMREMADALRKNRHQSVEIAPKQPTGDENYAY